MITWMMIPIILAVARFLTDLLYPLVSSHYSSFSNKCQMVTHIVLQVFFLLLFICQTIFDYKAYSTTSVEWTIWAYILMYSLLTFVIQARLYSLVYRVKHEKLKVFALAYAAASLTTIIFLSDIALYEHYRIVDSDVKSLYRDVSSVAIFVFIMTLMIISTVLTAKLYKSPELKKE